MGKNPLPCGRGSKVSHPFRQNHHTVALNMVGVMFGMVTHTGGSVPVVGDDSTTAHGMRMTKSSGPPVIGLPSSSLFRMELGSEMGPQLRRESQVPP